MYKRLIQNLLHVNNLRKFVGYEIFRAATNSNFKLEIWENPPLGKILVLAPHPDDDIIGCGGTLKLHTEQGDKIKVVYLTDGSGGIRTKENPREKEAIEAARTIGYEDLVFWRYPDGKLTTNKTTTELLKEIIKNFEPDVIYAPSFLDPHPDHFETAKILRETLPLTSFDGTILSYEVWSPIYANRLVNIDKPIKNKKEALAAHSSQISARGYLSSIMGLAQYRAGMFNVGQYAEAFFSCNKKLYIKLFDLINMQEK